MENEITYTKDELNVWLGYTNLGNHYIAVDILLDLDDKLTAKEQLKTIGFAQQSKADLILSDADNFLRLAPFLINEEADAIIDNLMTKVNFLKMNIGDFSLNTENKLQVVKPKDTDTDQIEFLTPKDIEEYLMIHPQNQTQLKLEVAFISDENLKEKTYLYSVPIDRNKMNHLVKIPILYNIHRNEIIMTDMQVFQMYKNEVYLLDNYLNKDELLYIIKEVEIQLVIYLISLYHLEKIIKIQDKLK